MKELNLFGRILFARQLKQRNLQGAICQTLSQGAWTDGFVLFNFKISIKRISTISKNILLLIFKTLKKEEMVSKRCDFDTISSLYLEPAILCFRYYKKAITPVIEATGVIADT